MMTSRQIDLVQQSFRLIEPIIDDAAVVFYERLFEIDPSLQRLFHKSPRGQARLLAETLAIVVDGIDHPAQLRGAAEALGPRCAGYGVRDENYEAVGQALLWTLENGLKDTFTSEVREAWVAAYSWLAFTVQRAAACCRADARIGGRTPDTMPPHPDPESS
jgi:hemoglobin-like flavoprotein